MTVKVAVSMTVTSLEGPFVVACVRATVAGTTANPFTLNTIPTTIQPDEESGRIVRELSRKRYGRPRKEVLAEIESSIAPKEEKDCSDQSEPGDLLKTLKEIGTDSADTNN